VNLIDGLLENSARLRYRVCEGCSLLVGEREIIQVERRGEGSVGNRLKFCNRSSVGIG
jgi:hypothetical protein